MRRPVALALAAGMLLSVSACGGDDEKKSEPSGPATESAVETVDVNETEYELDPANPRIAKPGRVELRVKNDGQTVHALEVEAPGGEVETSQIQPGESASLAVDLDRPGRYEWYCPIGNHRERGMEGEITVAGSSQSGAGTTTRTTETQTTETDTTETDRSGSNSGSGGY